MKLTKKLSTMHQEKTLYFSIPRTLSKLLGWKKGDEVELDADTKKQTLTLRKK
jgi:bifunctional DNA-binding transcriptional regulator/antitoxin component of YhaV-PrlF toxin-antitoxin module